eukprot:10972607-Karenia_brevis.AAC.1
MAQRPQGKKQLHKAKTTQTLQSMAANQKSLHWLLLMPNGQPVNCDCEESNAPSIAGGVAGDTEFHELQPP